MAGSGFLSFSDSDSEYSECRGEIEGFPSFTLDELSEILERNKTKTLSLSYWTVGKSADFSNEYPRFHQAALANTSIVAIDFRCPFKRKARFLFPILNTLYRNLRNIKDLRLRDLRWGEDLDFCLNGTEQLRHIVIDHYDGEEELCLHRFKHHQQLLSLKFNFNRMMRLDGLAELPPSLQSLDIDYCNRGGTGNGLTTETKRFQRDSLEQLRLSSVAMRSTEEAACLVGFIKNAENLKDLELTFDEHVPDGLYDAIASLSSLGKLMVRESWSKGRPKRASIGDILTSCSNLTSVD